MKKLLIIGALVIGIGAIVVATNQTTASQTESCCEVEGKCTGKDNCTACKNCKYCKHCAENEGTCGVCK